MALEHQRRRLVMAFSNQTQLLGSRMTFRAQYARTHPIRRFTQISQSHDALLDAR
jgi:hypothetical protein